MYYGYIRVSTDKQNLENQKYEISLFMKQRGLKIDKWVMETISGLKDYKKRKLGKMLKNIGAGDVIVASEISRFGRNLFQIMNVLYLCMNTGCEVWTIKDNYRLGADIQSKVLAFAFGLSAEIERNLISQRTKEALQRLKSSGVKLGRKQGSTNHKHKIDNQKDRIINMLKENYSVSEIARYLNVSRVTLYKYMKKEQIDWNTCKHQTNVRCLQSIYNKVA